MRRGITLTELLVVVTIMVILLAISVPMFNAGNARRQVREAARGVNLYLGGARIKAKELGVPIGVLIERSKIEPQAGIVLRRIEMPELYTGETTQDRMLIAWDGWLAPDGTCLDRSTSPPPNGLPKLLTLYLRPDNSAIPPIFHSGDVIRLGYTNHRATIIGPGAVSESDLEDRRGINTTLWPGVGYVRWESGNQIDSGFPMRAIMERTDVLPPWLDDDPEEDDTDGRIDDGTTDWNRFITGTTAVPFQVERQPIYNDQSLAIGALAEPFQLPADAAVDFSASGTDSDPTLLAASSAGDNSPVMIIFAPTGEVSLMIHHSTPVPLRESLYLMIGRRERMLERDPDPPQGTMPRLYAHDNGLSNWQDPINFWATINPANGTSHASRVWPFDQAAYEQNTSEVFNWYDAGHRADALYESRTEAWNSQVIGAN